MVEFDQKLLQFTKLCGLPHFFTPTFQYFYTDISAISVTFRNSVPVVFVFAYVFVFEIVYVICMYTCIHVFVSTRYVYCISIYLFVFVVMSLYIVYSYLHWDLYLPRYNAPQYRKNPPEAYDPRLSSFAGDFWSMSVLYPCQEQE